MKKIFLTIITGVILMQLIQTVSVKKVKIALPVAGAATLYGKTLPTGKWWEQDMN